MSQNTILIIGAVVIIVENILPHLPIKANSTLQVILNIVKSLLPKKV
jgi:hypothetical protein